jgi:hypothetical protein
MPARRLLDRRHPGTGLGAISRMSQLFDIYSQPGHGTAVVAQLWPEARAPRGEKLEIGAIVVRPRTRSSAATPGATSSVQAARWSWVSTGWGTDSAHRRRRRWHAKSS